MYKKVLVLLTCDTDNTKRSTRGIHLKNFSRRCGGVGAQGGYGMLIKSNPDF